MSLVGLILLSLSLGLLAWLGFVWSVRSGQYDDPEGPKYRMLDDDGEEPAGPGGAVRGEPLVPPPPGDAPPGGEPSDSAGVAGASAPGNVDRIGRISGRSQGRFPGGGG